MLIWLFRPLDRGGGTAAGPDRAPWPPDDRSGYGRIGLARRAWKRFSVLAPYAIVLAFLTYLAAHAADQADTVGSAQALTSLMHFVVAISGGAAAIGLIQAWLAWCDDVEERWNRRVWEALAYAGGGLTGTMAGLALLELGLAGRLPLP